MEQWINQTVKKTNLSVKQVQNVVSLLQEGNTVPFIARYRKEQTGALDEIQIKLIADTYDYEKNLSERKDEVIRLIAEQDKLTTELEKKIANATQLQQVEDLYRPYRQKRRTKATIAKEKGLEPLATTILTYPSSFQIEKEAQTYIDVEQELNTVEDVLAGVNDIIAEIVAEDPKVREALRGAAMKEGLITAELKKGAEDEKGVFSHYYEYQESVKTIVPHRTLALNRGEKENVLKVGLTFPKEAFIGKVERLFIQKHGSPVVPLIETAITDAYTRLIEPSIEREVRNRLTEVAEEQAISIFAENLKQLLLQPPMKEQVILGIDPAFRTGCKWAVIDDTGKPLDIGVIYPTAPHHKEKEAAEVVRNLITKYQVKMVAIGNGTASRETEQFVASVLKDVKESVFYVIVNEAGASVYSASELARNEFPNLQVEQRSAISIARRLQDPLAELVKIDPKSVGVGQYQHDVTQKKLNESLRFIVETVVNRVGVNVNTASAALLSYVSGLNKTQATNIANYRNENGAFVSRVELKKVPRLGKKSLEQAVGFLRIAGGKNPLDATAIHPESYSEAKTILETLKATVHEIGSNDLKEKVGGVQKKELQQALDIGQHTLEDLLDAFIRPNRDPRDEVTAPQLKQDVLKMEDLEKGMELQGTVRNIVDFGAFIDIGVKQDGLVHISKLANRFVKHPLDVVSIGEIVTVWVETIDYEKERIGLTMKQP
ncbi:Tex family protein [Bacillus sp. Marseille-P3800]|uniref:Tex family protein n=1 Tax=Bacillus sp. Marseille-P3800 TaxID=2014782 RepID=UPI000C075919|nr:Tex family protein [Bacillus sp. Marseille-P3800]